MGADAQQLLHSTDKLQGATKKVKGNIYIKCDLLFLLELRLCSGHTGICRMHRTHTLIYHRNITFIGTWGYMCDDYLN